ncbi:MAG: hypothetical protein ABI633_00510 [Burkholderiales bacterium]
MNDSSGRFADGVLTPYDVFIDTQPSWAQLPCEPPTNLDSLIRADHETLGESMGARWYRGVDGAGVVHIFQFQRGGPIELWHRSLTKQGLHSVTGPFRSQHHAHLGTRPVATGEAEPRTTHARLR